MRRRILLIGILTGLFFTIISGGVTIASAETATKNSDEIEEIEKDVSDLDKSPNDKTKDIPKNEDKKIEDLQNKEENTVSKETTTLAQFEDSIIVSLKRNSLLDLASFQETIKTNIVGTIQAPNDLKSESDIVLFKILDESKITTMKAGIFPVTAMIETKENKYNLPFKYEVLYEKATIKLTLLSMDPINKILKLQTAPNCSVGIPEGREENIIANQDGVATIYYDKWQQATKSQEAVQFKSCAKNGEYSELLTIKNADLFPEEKISKTRTSDVASGEKDTNVVLPKTGEQKSGAIVIIGAIILIATVAIIIIKKGNNKTKH